MFLGLRAESWVLPFQKPCGDSEGELRLIRIDYGLAEAVLEDLGVIRSSVAPSSSVLVNATLFVSACAQD